MALGWNTQYYHHYSLLNGTLTNLGAGTTRVANQGGVSRVPSQTYHDLSVRYRFTHDARRYLRDLDLSLGIQNIFDRKPPVVAGQNAPVTAYSAYADARLRRFTLTMTKHFGN